MFVFFFFFFSSRRRHTRSLRDWSSNVCSSDLSQPGQQGPTAPGSAGSGAKPKLSPAARDRKSTRLNSSHVEISYAVFCLKKKKKKNSRIPIYTKKINTT